MSAPKFIDNQWDAGEDTSPRGGRPFVGSPSGADAEYFG
jgi:hypothetical protein